MLRKLPQASLLIILTAISSVALAQTETQAKPPQLPAPHHQARLQLVGARRGCAPGLRRVE